MFPENPSKDDYEPIKGLTLYVDQGGVQSRSFNIYNHTYRNLAVLAEKSDITIAAVVRSALNEYLLKYLKNKTE